MARILLVEDDESVRAFVARALEIDRHGVVTAEDGEIGLETFLADQEGFDLVLTDIQMPLLDGLGLAKKIRENTRFDKLIIIAITANITKNNIDNCYSCGMNGFLTKPIELVKLKSLLMEHSQTMVNTRSEKSDGENIASDSFDQLDITLLKAMLGDDPSVHCMVFNAFLQTAGEQIKLANAYAKSKNYVDLAFQAHALKSSSKSVGAIELANICQQIETQAENETVKNEYIQQLEERFNAVVTQLKSYCLRYEKRT